MSAADCIFANLEVGSEVIAVDDLYGGTRRLFEKSGNKKIWSYFQIYNYKKFFKYTEFLNT